MTVTLQIRPGSMASTDPSGAHPGGPRSEADVFGASRGTVNWDRKVDGSRSQRRWLGWARPPKAPCPQSSSSRWIRGPMVGNLRSLASSHSGARACGTPSTVNTALPRCRLPPRDAGRAAARQLSLCFLYLIACAVSLLSLPNRASCVQLPAIRTTT